jgi:hypothetical protein
MGASVVLLDAAASYSSAAGGMEEVTAGIANLGTIMTSVVSMITGNPILVLFLAASVISLGIGLFMKLRRK